MNCTVRQASRNLSKLLKMATAGEEVVLVQRGKPIAKLVPVREEKVPAKIRKPRGPGALAGQITCTADVFEPLTASELAGLGFE